MTKSITFEKVNVDLLPFEKVELLFQQRLLLIEIEQRNQIAKSKKFQDIIAKINKLKSLQN
jgi:hypothetical protein